MSKTAKRKKKGSASVQALPLCVLYGFEPGSERYEAICALMAQRGVRVKLVDATALGTPVGALVGAPGFRPKLLAYTGEAIETEFMLLAYVAGEPMDQLLCAMRDAGCSIDHKAMLTPTNRLWPLGQLIKQVMTEHAVMHGNA